MKNLVYANRLAQQTVKMGKDIRSDRDILEEELIKPTKIEKHKPSTTTTIGDQLVPADIRDEQTHEEPSTKQLIKYKQQIRLENDRRQHREKLAGFAKQQRAREQFFKPDAATKPSEVQHDRIDDQHTLTSNIPEKTGAQAIHKPMAKSKEEEELLNDETMYHSRGHRPRERNKKRALRSRSNTPTLHKQYAGGVSATAPMMQFGVCKRCGNLMNNEGNPTGSYSQQVSSKFIHRFFFLFY